RARGRSRQSAPRRCAGSVACRTLAFFVRTLGRLLAGSRAAQARRFAPQLAALTAFPERMPDAAQEQFFQREAQAPDRGAERKPAYLGDVFGGVVARPFRGKHAPKLHQLRPATRRIGDGAEKLLHLHAMTGFLPRFALGAGDRILVTFEFAAGQDPA